MHAAVGPVGVADIIVAEDCPNLDKATIDNNRVDLVGDQLHARDEGFGELAKEILGSLPGFPSLRLLGVVLHSCMIDDDHSVMKF